MQPGSKLSVLGMFHLLKGQMKEQKRKTKNLYFIRVSTDYCAYYEL